MRPRHARGRYLLQLIARRGAECQRGHQVAVLGPVGRGSAAHGCQLVRLYHRGAVCTRKARWQAILPPPGPESTERRQRQRQGCRCSTALQASPMASKGRPHTVRKLMTSAFTWAGCGRTDGSGVGVNYQKNWFAANYLLLANFMFTDIEARADTVALCTHEWVSSPPLESPSNLPYAHSISPGAASHCMPP